jgi:hypothetical protein
VRKKVGYVAFDGGAKLTLQALAERIPGAWLGGGISDWEDALHAQGIELLACGTSDTRSGRALEADARVAANAAGVPCVVIEDFPGNYRAVPGGRPRLLFVGDKFEAKLAREKDGGIAVEICPAVRYDGLRRRLDELRTVRQADENVVLWVGQPETADSHETLRRLLPAINARGAALWFRAHPRDEGYARGAYGDLLKNAEDVTSRPLAEVLARRPALVATQFSSVAIEAGFWGICALNALFVDVGGKTLAAKKGYAVPPWCEEGAAFLVTRESEVEEVVGRAFADRAAREVVMRRFDRYFRVHEEGTQKILDVLYIHGFL